MHVCALHARVFDCMSKWMYDVFACTLIYDVRGLVGSRADVSMSNVRRINVRQCPTCVGVGGFDRMCVRVRS